MGNIEVLGSKKACPKCKSFRNKWSSRPNLKAHVLMTSAVGVGITTPVVRDYWLADSSKLSLMVLVGGGYHIMRISLLYMQS